MDNSPPLIITQSRYQFLKVFLISYGQYTMQALALVSNQKYTLTDMHLFIEKRAEVIMQAEKTVLGVSREGYIHLFSPMFYHSLIATILFEPQGGMCTAYVKDDIRKCYSHESRHAYALLGYFEAVVLGNISAEIPPDSEYYPAIKPYLSKST